MIHEPSVYAVADVTSLPAAPGCYWFTDNSGKVIYVGKSKNIRKRVASYFRKNKSERADDPSFDPLNFEYKLKLEQMVLFIQSVGCNQTNTELEALMLEHWLIKQHHPIYNSALNRNRRTLFLRIPLEGRFPLIITVRKYIRESKPNKRKEASEEGLFYDIGPFYGSRYTRHALQCIGDFWRLPTCERIAYKPCGRFHFGQCIGPCTDEADSTEYRAHLTEAVHFFNGDILAAQKRYDCLLNEYIEQLAFERAANFRDAYMGLQFWAHKLDQQPKDWYGCYFLFAKALHENIYMAAYASGGCLHAWVMVRDDADMEDLAYYIAHGDNAISSRTERLYIPATREEGEKWWMAFVDIAAYKRYVMHTPEENMDEHALLEYLWEQFTHSTAS
jgi:excinuclease ABC subunit C